MIHVLKASGDKESFSEEKVIKSIHRASIPAEIQPYVVAHVKSKLYDNISSREIFHHINEFLEKSPQPFMKSRYSLKQAIMALGPTGYPFEDYLGKIMQNQNFLVKTRIILAGKCVTHEIDVIAEKHTALPTKIMIEAKFHNDVGIHTNVHVPMYTKARFDDVKEKHGFTESWLVTNTKATVDSIAYAGCVGLKIITWGYPEGESLRDIVEKHHLFPITSLTSLSSEQKQHLLAKDIVLCRDICSDHSILNSLNLSFESKQKVISEVEFICETTS